MIGPGKYAAACTAAREMTGAKVAIVIILGGDKGSGFSVQGEVNTTITVEHVADLLESVAAELRRDAERLKQSDARETME